MLKTAVVASILLFSTTARAATPPCDTSDSECLLRKLLESTYELEACNQRNARLKISNEALNKALDEEESRSDHGGRVFVFGMLTGVVFVGLLSTIALKVVK